MRWLLPTVLFLSGCAALTPLTDAGVSPNACATDSIRPCAGPCNATQRCSGGVWSTCSPSCPAGTSCNGSACVAPDAGGCDPNSCDAGMNCVGTSCDAGASCNGGACDAGVTCNASSCASGCCDGTVCRAASTSTCGSAGAACNPCDSSRADSCAGGACRCGPSAACAAGQNCVGGTCTVWCGTGPACVSGQRCVSSACVCDATRANRCEAGTCRCGSAATCASTQQCTPSGSSTPPGVGFNDQQDRLVLPSSAWPTSTTSWTFAGWVRLAADRNTFSAFFTIEQPAGHSVEYNELITGADGTTLGLWDHRDQVAVTLGTMTVGTWYFAAISVGANGAATTWFAPQGGTLTRRTGTVAVVDHTEMSYLGASNFAATEFIDGSMALARLWNGVLSDAEIAAEFASTAPVRTSGLIGDWRLSSAAGVTADSSGLGRTLTKDFGATHVTVAGPVISNGAFVCSP